MGRFQIEASAIQGGNITMSNREDIRHISKVLRLGLGDIIEFTDNDAFEYVAEITSVKPESLVAVILDKQRFAREPKTQITLFQSLPKQGKMETIIQKSVEIGVSEIVPFFSERTVIQENEKTNKKSERWNRVSAEAVKQCRRGTIPPVRDPIRFRQALGALGKYDLVLIPYENEEGRTMKTVLRGLLKTPKTVAILIGPEGGFTVEEIQEVTQANGISVSLGKPILRTETAGLVAAAMVLYEFELD